MVAIILMWLGIVIAISGLLASFEKKEFIFFVIIGIILMLVSGSFK